MSNKVKTLEQIIAGWLNEPKPANLYAGSAKQEQPEKELSIADVIQTLYKRSTTRSKK